MKMKFPKVLHYKLLIKLNEIIITFLVDYYEVNYSFGSPDVQEPPKSCLSDDVSCLCESVGFTKLQNFLVANSPSVNILEKIGPSDIATFATSLLEDDEGDIWPNIQNDHSNSMDKLRDIFSRWLKGTGRRPTASWKTLVSVFRESKLNHVADIIESTCPII